MELANGSRILCLSRQGSHHPRLHAHPHHHRRSEPRSRRSLPGGPSPCWPFLTARSSRFLLSSATRPVLVTGGKDSHVYEEKIRAKMQAMNGQSKNPDYFAQQLREYHQKIARWIKDKLKRDNDD